MSIVGGAVAVVVAATTIRVGVAADLRYVFAIRKAPTPNTVVSRRNLNLPD